MYCGFISTKSISEVNALKEDKAEVRGFGQELTEIVHISLKPLSSASSKFL
jgi:hypothetical protein